MAHIEPRLYRIEELIRQVREGLVRVPRFQRGFVWQRDQLLELLDSVRHRYPIGTLFLWKTPERYSSFDHIGPIRLPTDAPAQPAEVGYVLDGHQRISCLVGVLGLSDEEARSVKGEERRFLVFYDLATRKFVHARSPQDHHLPARYLVQSPADVPFDRLTRWFDERRDRTKAGSPERATWDAYRREAFQLQTTFAQYQVRYDDVTRADLVEAVQIFARVNQQGTSARPVDVFSALSWRADGFDFAQRARALLESTPGFETLGTQPILRALLACLGRPAYDRDWPTVLECSSSELPQVFMRLSEAFARAVLFLAERVGARHARVVPYGLQVVFLTWFYEKQPTPTDAQVQRLVEWFWASSYGASYGGAGALAIDLHIQRARELLSGMDQPILPERPKLHALPRRFHPRSARVRAWHLYLASLGPQNSAGAPIDAPLGGGLEDARPVATGEVGWLLGGRILLGRTCKDPARELHAAAQGLFKERILASHGVSNEAYLALATDDIPRFISLRFDHLLTHEVEHARQFVDVPEVRDLLDEAEPDSDLLDG